MSKTKKWKDLDLSQYEVIGCGSDIPPENMKEELFSKGVGRFYMSMVLLKFHHLFLHLVISDISVKTSHQTFVGNEKKTESCTSNGSVRSITGNLET